jgi:hypothetical protein
MNHLPLVDMSSLVIDLVALGGELPAAVLAREGLLARVGSQVVPQTGPLSETAVTASHRTPIRWCLLASWSCSLM